MLNALEKVMYPNGKIKALGDITSGSVSSIIDEVHANTSAITSITAQLSALVDDVGTNTSAITSINTKLGHLTYDSETEKYNMSSGLNVQWHLVAQHHLRANDFDLGENNAGFRNSIYRGKNLGTSITAEQWDSIQAGTFDNMFIGDYWMINSRKYIIAAFDYWMGRGNTPVLDHHVVIVPETDFGVVRMNSSNTSSTGYGGSELRTSGMDDCKATINTDFGAGHILSHKELFTNGVTSGKASSWNWYDSTVEVMNECMVVGTHVISSSPAYDSGIDCTILPLFLYKSPYEIGNFWMRDIVSDTQFAYMHGNGFIGEGNASKEDNIKLYPCFAIYNPITQQNNTRKKASKKKGE